MKILLVNDDGINSKKLHKTREKLLKYGEVITVAPSQEQSAKSMSLTYGGTTYTKYDDFTYSVDGTPADSVIFALVALDLKPDILVSGTNNGYNIGIDIRYSGTVGAALQALFFGVPSIAISSDYNKDLMLDIELENALDYIIKNKKYSTEFVVNINLPQESFGLSNGIMETNIYNMMHPYNPVLLKDKYVPKRVYGWIGEIPNDSEQYAYMHGFTSVSKVKL